MPDDMTEENLYDDMLELEKDVSSLRKMLWLRHGVDCVLYGDDGEMQCNSCMIDFKRDSVVAIEERIHVLAIRKVVEYQQSDNWCLNET